MRVSYSPGYFVPLPDGHRFPMGKFPALHELLIRRSLITPSRVVVPRPADWSDLLRVHTRSYLADLANGTLDRRAERKMGLPWSRQLVDRSRLAVQGTLNAALMALEDGIAANLAGGTHHAQPGYGEGFCVLNDAAITIRLLQSSQWVQRVLILDLDVHQGNGNAGFFGDDERVFTFSMHGAKNYPFEKPPSSLDVALPDNTNDESYLDALASHLPDVLHTFRPDIVFYLAGTDVVENDRFGRLSLTEGGLWARERYVLSALHEADLPLVLLLSGGYASSPLRTAELHAISHEEARHVYGRDYA